MIKISLPKINDGSFDFKDRVFAEFNSFIDANEFIENEFHKKAKPIIESQINKLNANSIEQYFELQKESIKNPHHFNQKALFDIDFPWQISFYEHPNFSGKRFKLGVLQQTNPIALLNPAILSQCDWESNLINKKDDSGNQWNDRISSIKCHSTSKYWAICEHVDFGGNTWISFGDNSDLTNNNWNDSISSIVMNSIPANVLQIALKILSKT
ncbi:hypothetical protein [Leptospira stimsonii]|uniref:Uncharacterized protein n=1 Tax=Leptospira stimsonii TaxID=2202203 RepID=A0ABY2N9S7_9LEPT|nr:hypothetical protein [Leptospira stimsonii]TGK10696.1 hypothetical protein EHO98_22740 [Leptospira stimsonii]TGM18980.1 hypothetical protein EHQ90_05520 [Leptospira stimsonii]